MNKQAGINFIDGTKHHIFKCMVLSLSLHQLDVIAAMNAIIMTLFITLIDLCDKDNIVFAVIFCTFRTGGIEKVQLVHFLAF